jgi:hypothetical protein
MCEIFYCRKHANMSFIYAFYHHRVCLSLDSVYLSLAFPSLNFLRIVIWWESISHRWMDFCLKILRIREIARLSTQGRHREGSSPRWAEIYLYYNHDLAMGVQRACEVWGYWKFIILWNVISHWAYSCLAFWRIILPQPSGSTEQEDECACLKCL